MAGKPRSKRVLEELRLLAIAELGEDVEEPTALDYVEYYLADGNTYIKLALKLNIDSRNSALREYDPPLTGESISRIIRKEFGEQAVEARTGIARTRGAHALVEQTHEIADGAVESSEDAARARNRIASRQWAATAYAKDVFGNRGNQVNVQINVPTMHLDSLRQRTIAHVLPEPALISASDITT